MFSVFILFTPCNADDTGGVVELVLQKKVMNLSLQQGKLMVLQSNLDIAIEKVTPRIQEVAIYREEGVFDPLLSGSVEREERITPFSSRSSVAAGGKDIAESEIYNINAGISGKIPLGTEYRIEFDDIKTEDSFNEFRAEYDSFAGLKIAQPLLKDFGSDANLFTIHIAQKDRDISVADLKQSIIDTIAEFRNAYWDLVFAIDELNVLKESLKLAESLLDLEKKRLKAEVISPLEVTQAEAGVASREENVILARRLVRERENALKRLISSDVYNLRGVTIIPSDIPAVTPVTPDLDESFREGLANRPDYHKQKIEIEKDNITIQYAENQKFPRIDLEGSYGYEGLSDSFEGSLKDLDGKASWAMGVVAKFPLGNRTAKGDLHIARLEASQALLNLKSLEQDILVEIDNAVTDVKTNEERIAVTRVSTRMAEEALKAEVIKLKAGLSTSHNVLDFQEDLTRAKSREIKAVIDYNKSRTELARVKGTLLEEEGIEFDEYKETGIQKTALTETGSGR
jgi:outer membrane protein TolC